MKAIDIERILRKRKLLDSENPSNKRSSKYNITNIKPEQVNYLIIYENEAKSYTSFLHRFCIESILPKYIFLFLRDIPIFHLYF